MSYIFIGNYLFEIEMLILIYIKKIVELKISVDSLKFEMCIIFIGMEGVYKFDLITLEVDIGLCLWFDDSIAQLLDDAHKEY
jgi:hypothetical protein